MEYAHFDLYPRKEWRWTDFTPREMRSKSDNKLMINKASMDKLQSLRVFVGKPMRITSAYRSPAHNRKVRGARHSMHLKARAFDIPMKGHDPAQFEAAARHMGFTGFGFYQKNNFMHIDTGPPREWGDRWFARESLRKPPAAPVKHVHRKETPDPVPKPKNLLEVEKGFGNQPSIWRWLLALLKGWIK